MKVWTMTDRGLVRGENQDTYAVKTVQDYTVCVVCDGMGGAAAGKVASEIAATTFTQEAEAALQPEMTPQQLQELSASAAAAANRAIRASAEENPDYQGMGTTLVSAISYDGGAILCNVGDSRAYLITPEGIRRLTRDHSLVESMVERGDITAEEARHHPGRNYITRALGPDETAECDVYEVAVQQGEYLLLCSDGLVNTVTDQEMLFEVIHGESPDTALQRLLEISRSHGAPDNVTAVLMRQV